jgi:formylglycine-generating enzyme required for sulfatase activity
MRVRHIRKGENPGACAGGIGATGSRETKKEEAARIAEEKRRKAEEALRLIEPEMVRVGNFSVGKYEVTQGQWRAVMGSNPSQFKKGDDYPVETFSWDDLQEYIRRLNSKTGKRYRLPTEDEWYRACQGGGAEQDYCGGKDLDQVAWYKINSGDSTHPVGSKRANGLGIHDMSGNVWEWTGSLHEPDSPWRVIRGGSWYFLPVHLLSTYRSRHHPAYRYNDVGFRLALD